MNIEEQNNKIDAIEQELLSAFKNKQEFTISDEWQDSVMNEIQSFQFPNVIFIDSILWKFATVSSMVAVIVTITGLLLGAFDLQGFQTNDFFAIDQVGFLEV